MHTPLSRALRLLCATTLALTLLAAPAYADAPFTARFAPGVGLDKVEIHDEEHGLYVTAGGGTYLLEERELPVEAGDFIYMAPYCPQSFVAGDEPSEYLLYKDVWRDGF